VPDAAPRRAQRGDNRQGRHTTPVGGLGLIGLGPAPARWTREGPAPGARHRAGEWARLLDCLALEVEAVEAARSLTGEEELVQLVDQAGGEQLGDGVLDAQRVGAEGAL
jgi:hypothetical protein